MIKSKNNSPSEYTEIFSWGSDRYGQLGLGAEINGKCYCTPRLYTFNISIIEISCGEEHSAFIAGNGHIFTMGNNADGRLGLGDEKIRFSTTPCLVESLSKLKAIHVSCGWGHTAAVLENGDLYAWGVAEYGALGISTHESQYSPCKVSFASKKRPNIVWVSCGTRHTSIVDDMGNLYMCGAGDCGQLGTNSKEKEILPVHLNKLHVRIKQTSCGIFHTLALTESGTVLAAGGNNFGQLGTGNKRSSLVFTLVKALEKERVIKICAGTISGCISNTGNVYVWGTGVFGEYLLPTQIRGFGNPIIDFGIGGCFGVFVDTEQKIYSWGSNASGELGLGDFEPREKPEIIGFLKDKKITQVSCGGSYVIALGQTFSEKIENDQENILQFGTKTNLGTFEENKQSFTKNDNDKSEVYKRIYCEKERITKLNLEKQQLEHKLREVKRKVENLQNEKYRAGAIYTRSNQILNEYRDKIEREIALKEYTLSEKDDEINHIQTDINRLETLKTTLQDDVSKNLHKYKDKYEMLENDIQKYRKILTLRQAENEELKRKKLEIERQKEPIFDTMNTLRTQVKAYEEELSELGKQQENMRREIIEKEKFISETDKNYIELMNENNEKEYAIQNHKKMISVVESQGLKEINELNHTLNEKIIKGEEMQKTLNLKQQEIDNLTKESLEWSQKASKVVDENTNLKKTMEFLEQRNRKLLEDMNYQLFSKAAEYKERTLKALTNSASPYVKNVTTEENLKVLQSISPFKASVKQENEMNNSKFTKSNYELIQMLDSYDPAKNTNLRVTIEENKISAEIQQDFKKNEIEQNTVNKIPVTLQEYEKRDKEILKTTQNLLNTLRTSPIKTNPKITTPTKIVFFYCFKT